MKDFEYYESDAQTRIGRIERHLPRHPLTSKSPGVRLEGWNFHTGTTLISPLHPGGSLERETLRDGI